MLQRMSGLRSERWFGGRDISGFIHRASLHAEGISRSALAGRPVIGICNSWSELVSCNLHFRGLAEAVKLVKGRDLKAIFGLVFDAKEGWNETRALGVILKVCEIGSSPLSDSQSHTP